MSLADELENIGPLDGDRALVWRRKDVTRDEIAALMDVLIERAESMDLPGPISRHVPLLIVLAPGDSLELADEEAMRKAGWVRA